MTTSDSVRIRKKTVNESLANSFSLKINVLRNVPLLQLISCLILRWLFIENFFNHATQ